MGVGGGGSVGDGVGMGEGEGEGVGATDGVAVAVFACGVAVVAGSVVTAHACSNTSANARAMARIQYFGIVMILFVM